MSLPTVVGLTGKAGCGKDTAADYLRDWHGYQKYSFALPIKRGLNAMFGWVMTQWEDREWKEAVQEDLGFSPRVAAQTLGTEWGRDVMDPLIWVKAMQRYRHRHSEDQTYLPLVIPDVRFDNEAEAISRMGGIVVEIVRPTQGEVAEHSSENGVKEKHLHARFTNDGSVHELHTGITAIVGIYA